MTLDFDTPRCSLAFDHRGLMKGSKDIHPAGQ